jgi:hypothetical protein
MLGGGGAGGLGGACSASPACCWRWRRSLGGLDAPIGGYLALLAATFAFALNQTLNGSCDGAGLVGVISAELLACRSSRRWRSSTGAAGRRSTWRGCWERLLAGRGGGLHRAAFRHSDASRLAPWGFRGAAGLGRARPRHLGHGPDAAMLAGGAVVSLACLMSERARRRGLPQSIPAGKAWVPSGPSGSGVTARTAESGKAP